MIKNSKNSYTFRCTEIRKDEEKKFWKAQNNKRTEADKNSWFFLSRVPDDVSSAFLELDCSISSKGGGGEGKRRGEDGGRNGFIATKSGNYCRGTNFWHRALATARFSDTVKLFRSFHDSFHPPPLPWPRHGEGWRKERAK